MCKILIFGGTTEGRELGEFCVKNKIQTYISVTTDYGADLLEESDFLHIITGKMNCVEMSEFIMKNRIKLVIDATHPYAIEATKNINCACQKNEVKCLRIKRETGGFTEYGRYFNDISSLIDYLNQSNDGILITTGSKELRNFCRVNNFRERCTVRVLPSEKILEYCVALGFVEENIIAEKGPFSEERNIEHLKRYDAHFLVTKESGAVGGFDSKIVAAEKCGAELLIIRRPEEVGISLTEAEKILLTEKIDE